MPTNPPGLYSEGRVNLNPLPYLHYEMQAKAHKQAKDEALDKHFENLPNTINEKGVRDQEIEGLNNRKNAIYQFGVQNRELLKHPEKDNGAASYHLNKMLRETEGYVQKSKNRSATAIKLAQLRGNPKYDYIFRNPDIINQIAGHEKGVDEEGSEAINFDKLTLPPPPFDRAKYINGIKIKPNPTDPEYKDIPGDKFNRLEVTNKKFSPDDLNSLHIQATTELYNNPSFQNEIDRVKQDPIMAAQMAETFQKHYGHPIQNQGDEATAYTLSSMDLTPTQRTVRNEDAHNAEWTRRHNKVVADRVKKVAGESGSTVNDVYAKIDANQDTADISTTDNGMQSGNRIKAARFNTLPNDAQQILMKSFKESGHDVTADDIYQVQSPNGDIVFYQTDDEGKPRPSEKLKIFTVSKVGTNLKAQPGAPEKREVISQGEPNKKKEKYPLPSGKPRTVKQGSFTYTYNPENGEYE